MLLLHSPENSPGILHPGLGSSGQEGRGLGVGPEKAMKMIQELEHVSWEDRLRALGFFSLQKALGRPSCDFLIRKMEKDFLPRPVGQGATVLNQKRVDLAWT